MESVCGGGGGGAAELGSAGGQTSDDDGVGTEFRVAGVAVVEVMVSM